MNRIGHIPIMRPADTARSAPVSIDLLSPLQQVVVGLKAKPEPLRNSEIPHQPQVRIGGD